MIETLISNAQINPYASPPTTRVTCNVSNEKDTAEVAQRILRTSGYSGLWPIACEFRDDTLILSGRVSSFFLKQLGQQVLRKLPGVKAIVNNVEVQVSNCP